MKASKVVFLVFLILMSLWVVNTQPVKAVENFWTTKAPVPTEGVGYRSAVLNGKVYFLPGSVHYEYDPVTDTWSAKKPMPTPRWGFGVAACQNRIYVIGGSLIGSGAQTGINEVYDPVTDTWETKAQMPTQRRGLDANVVNGKIYLIGGGTNVTEVYDPATDSWNTKASMFYPVYRYASAVVDNKIYIIGGQDETQPPGSDMTYMDANQVYDTVTDTWSLGAPLPMGVRYAAVGATTGVWAPKRIYVIGGVIDMDGINSTQVYNPETNSWTVGTPMPTARFGLAVAVVNDKLYAMAGMGNVLGVFSTENEQYTPFGFGTLPPETSPPTVSIVLPENKTYTTSNVSLTFAMGEPASWIGYSLDRQANVTIAGNTTLTGLTDGPHSLTVYANDAAGNIGTSETVYFSIKTQTQQSEPFPITWITGAIAVIVVATAAGTVYLIRKRKK